MFWALTLLIKLLNNISDFLLFSIYIGVLLVPLVFILLYVIVILVLISFIPIVFCEVKFILWFIIVIGMLL